VPHWFSSATALQRRVEEIGDDLLGDIVASGAQTSGGDHEAGAGQPILHGVANGPGAVGHGGGTHETGTHGVERGGEFGGVGVEGETEQQLVADRD
jgi:hypothetical protein